MQLSNESFERIVSGTKRVEFRLFDQKRQQIKIGDTIIFTNISQCEKITVTVIGLSIFDSFERLFNSLNRNLMGWTPKIAEIRKYYTEADEKRHGVIGIHISYMK